jgi:hypothetical protein
MSDLDFLALHGLAVRKHGGPATVASLLGADEAAVGIALEGAVANGYAAGAKGIFMVAPAGQAYLAEQYPVVFADARGDEAFVGSYERFEKVNVDLLTLMTDWQTMPAGGGRISNDHSDADYDQSIIDRLGSLHERAERVIGKAADAQPRVGRYLERLEEAYDKVLAGDRDYVSGVRVDSYHTVWFELHEDLLRMLGRTRQE